MRNVNFSFGQQDKNVSLNSHQRKSRILSFMNSESKMKNNFTFNRDLQDGSLDQGNNSEDLPDFANAHINAPNYIDYE